MGSGIETDKAGRQWINLPEQAPGILTEQSGLTEKFLSYKI